MNITDKDQDNQVISRITTPESLYRELCVSKGRAFAVSALLDRYDDRQQAITDSFYGSDLIRTEDRQIRTIGLFLWKMTNNGVARVVSEQIPTLRSMGYRVVLITGEEDRQTDFALPDDIEWVTITKPRPFDSEHYLARAEDLIAVLHDYSIDLVIHHAASSIELIYDIICIRGEGIPVIAMSHEMFAHHLVNNSGDRDYRKLFIYRLANKVVVLSTLDEHIYRSFGINAVYIQNVFPPVSDKPAFRKGGRDVIWAGRLEGRAKQYFDVVDIAERTVKALPDVRFHVYGRATNPKIDKKLRKRIREAGLKENVILEGFSNNITARFDESDIYLMTSAFESFSLTLAESAARGVPAVVYDLPYLELIRDGRGCICVPQRDADAAAESIIDLLTDDEKRYDLAYEAWAKGKDFSKYDYTGIWKSVIQGFNQTAEEFRDDDLRTAVEVLLLHSFIGAESYKKKSREVEKLREEIEESEISAQRDTDTGIEESKGNKGERLFEKNRFRSIFRKGDN